MSKNASKTAVRAGLVCKRDGCGNGVPVGRREWCSAECREIARRPGLEAGREQTPAPSLSAAKTVQREITQREYRKTLEEAAEAQENLERELALYQKMSSDGFKSPRWLAPREDRKDHHGTLLAFMSDTHFGEVVEESEMNGYNKYNIDIAEKRLRAFFEKTIYFSRNYLAGVKYDGIVLALDGDIVSGDIHDELTETNELSTYETVEWAVPRLGAGVEMFAETYGKVHVVSAPGNHGRNTKKPRHKKRSANNADTHIARLLAQRFDGNPNVTFSIPNSLDVEFDVYGYRFSMEHGDQAKGGDGQVGALGPAKRLTLRKQTQSAEEGRPFKYLLMGHYHQYMPVASQGFVMNGSIKGMDEYARAWHFKPEPAQQALMVITPEHGITVQAPILVTNRAKEGW